MSARESARRFHFIREIATGGFGTVYLAKVIHADGFSRLVAVKLLKAQWTDNAEVVRRIRDEARLLGLLRHRNIVDVLDLTSIDGRTAVVMEYLEAVDFRTVAMHLKEVGGRMSVRAALEAMALVASALDAAYNRPPIPGDKPLRVIHRDIKPSNIMVDDTGMVKVLDYGVARSEIDNRESHTQELQFGSVDYMAPERLFFEPETPASDVYSLGATLYEIIALEKLGKAKGRPEKHAAFLHDRMSFLQLQTALSDEVLNDLESLLSGSLDFAHEKRPTAAEFFQRARAMARTLGDEDLGQWAEKLLPALIRSGQDVPVEPAMFQDMVLPEDSIALSRVVATGLADAARGNPAVGDSLRRGALAELEDSRSFSSVIAVRDEVREDISGAGPRVQKVIIPTQPPPEPDPPDAWEDRSTSLDVRATEPTNAVVDEPTLLAPASSLHPPLLVNPAALDAPEPHGLAALDGPTQAPHLVGPTLSLEPPPLPIWPPVDRDLPVSDADFDQLRARSAGPVDSPRPAIPPPGVTLAPADINDVSFVAGGPTLAPIGGPSPLITAPSRAVVKPVAAAVEEEESDDLDQEAPLPRRSALPMALLSGCLVGFVILGVGGALIAFDVGGLRGKLRGEAVAATAPSEPEQPVVAPPEPSGPTIRFASADSTTRRLNVECGATKDGRDGDEAIIALERADSCRVTAVLKDRNRLYATVSDVSTGSYLCFEAGKSECVRR